MRPLISRFFTELHKTTMKPLGFRKERHRFVRENGDRTEIVDFQGSSWNSREGPWRFYINIAIGFHDVPHKAGKGLWSCAHACGRIGALVKDASPHFDLDDKSYSTLMHMIPELIAAAMAALPPVLPRAHERARQGFLFSPLPVPGTWDDDTQQAAPADLPGAARP